MLSRIIRTVDGSRSSYLLLVLLFFISTLQTTAAVDDYGFISGIVQGSIPHPGDAEAFYIVFTFPTGSSGYTQAYTMKVELPDELIPNVPQPVTCQGQHVDSHIILTLFPVTTTLVDQTIEVEIPSGSLVNDGTILGWVLSCVGMQVDPDFTSGGVVSLPTKLYFPDGTLAFDYGSPSLVIGAKPPAANFGADEHSFYASSLIADSPTTYTLTLQPAGTIVANDFYQATLFFTWEMPTKVDCDAFVGTARYNVKCSFGASGTYRSFVVEFLEAVPSGAPLRIVCKNVKRNLQPIFEYITWRPVYQVYHLSSTNAFKGTSDLSVDLPLTVPSPTPHPCRLSFFTTLLKKAAMCLTVDNFVWRFLTGDSLTLTFPSFVEIEEDVECSGKFLGLSLGEFEVSKNSNTLRIRLGTNLSTASDFIRSLFTSGLPPLPSLPGLPSLSTSGLFQITCEGIGPTLESLVNQVNLGSTVVSGLRQVVNSAEERVDYIRNQFNVFGSEANDAYETYLSVARSRGERVFNFLHDLSDDSAAALGVEAPTIEQTSSATQEAMRYLTRGPTALYEDSVLRWAPAWQDLRDTTEDAWRTDLEPNLRLPEGFSPFIETTTQFMSLAPTNVIEPSVWNRFSGSSTLKASLDHSVGYVNSLGDMRLSLSSLPFTVPAGSYFQTPLGNYLQLTQDSVCTVNGVNTTYSISQNKLVLRIPQELDDGAGTLTSVICSNVRALTITPADAPLTELGAITLLNAEQSPLTELATLVLNTIRGVGRMGDASKHLTHASDTVSNVGTLGITIEPLNAEVVDELDILFPTTYSTGPLLSLAPTSSRQPDCQIFSGGVTTGAAIHDILIDGRVSGFRIISEHSIITESNVEGASQPVTISCSLVRRARAVHGNVNSIHIQAYRGHGDTRVLVSETTSGVLNGVSHAPTLPPRSVQLALSSHGANTLVTAEIAIKSLNVSLNSGDILPAILPDGYTLSLASNCMAAGENGAFFLIPNPSTNGATLIFTLPTDIPSRSPNSPSEEIPSFILRCESVRTPYTARAATTTGRLTLNAKDSQQRTIFTSSLADTPEVVAPSLREGTSLTAVHSGVSIEPAFALRLGLPAHSAEAMMSSISGSDKVVVELTIPASWASSVTPSRVASQEIKCFMGGQGYLDISVQSDAQQKLSVLIPSSALTQGYFRSIFCSGVDTSGDELSPLQVAIRSSDGSVWARSSDIGFVPASFATTTFAMQSISNAANSITNVTFVINGLPVDMESGSSFVITIPEGWAANADGASQCTIAQKSSTVAVLGPENSSPSDSSELSTPASTLQAAGDKLVITLTDGSLARGSGPGFDTTVTCGGFRVPNAASSATTSSTLAVEARVGDAVVGRRSGGTIPSIVASTLVGSAAITFSLPRVAARTDLIVTISPLSVDLAPRDEIGLQLPVGFDFDASGETSVCTLAPTSGGSPIIPLAIAKQSGQTSNTYTFALPESLPNDNGASAVALQASQAGVRVLCTNVRAPTHSMAPRNDLILQITATYPSVAIRASTSQATMQGIEPGHLGEQIATVWASAPVVSTVTSLVVIVRPLENTVPSGGAFAVQLPPTWAVDFDGSTVCTASQALVPVVGTTQTIHPSGEDASQGPILKFKLSTGETLARDRVFVLTCTRVRTPLQTAGVNHNILMWTENAAGVVIDKTTTGELAAIGNVPSDVYVQVTSTFGISRLLSANEAQALQSVFQGYLGGISNRVQVYRQALRPRPQGQATFARKEASATMHTAMIDTNSPQFLHAFGASNAFSSGSAGAQAQSECAERQKVEPGSLAASQACLSADATAMRAAAAREAQSMELKKAQAEKQEGGFLSFAWGLLQGKRRESDASRVQATSDFVDATTDDNVLDAVILLGSNTPTGVASSLVSVVDAAPVTPLNIQSVLGLIPLSISAPATIMIPRSCNDAQRNNDETDIDCGGNSCSQCPLGARCTVNGDCFSGLCSGNTCLATSSGSGGGGGGGGSTSSASSLKVAYLFSLLLAPLVAILVTRLTR